MTLLAAFIRALTMPPQRPVPVLVERYTAGGFVSLPSNANSSAAAPPTTAGSWPFCRRTTRGRSMN